MKLYYCQVCGRVATKPCDGLALSPGWDEICNCVANAIEVELDDTVWTKLRNRVMWGTYGKPPRLPRRNISMAKMSSSHIRAIFDDVERGEYNIHDEYIELFEFELDYRKRHKIIMPDL